MKSDKQREKKLEKDWNLTRNKWNVLRNQKKVWPLTKDGNQFDYHGLYKSAK